MRVARASLAGIVDIVYNSDDGEMDEGLDLVGHRSQQRADDWLLANFGLRPTDLPLLAYPACIIGFTALSSLCRLTLYLKLTSAFSRSFIRLKYSKQLWFGELVSLPS